MAEAAILAPCASRKFVTPELAATALILPKGSQAAVETAWRTVVAGLPAHRQAGQLYGGRGFGLARQAAARLPAQLYVISAGLGLIHAGRSIPAYGLTVSERGGEAVSRRIDGRFDPAAWWAAVNGTKYSERVGDVAQRHAGLLLVALTTPYAAMLGDDLASLPVSARERLRIFGHGVSATLPAALAPFAMPYDERLNGAVPGTRTDFAQRALRHFCEHATTDGSLDAAGNAGQVHRLLANHDAPTRRVRPRRSDDEIIDLIAGHLGRTKGIGRILRLVRDEDGLACEQARFARLYAVALRRSVQA